MKKFAYLPDFLGIGAQKAGTTWLWRQLTQHPGIWMPPKKEIHYFDRSVDYLSPNHLASDTFVSRILGKERHNRSFRRMMVRHLRAERGNLTLRRMCWYLRFFAGTYNDKWYASLFNDRGGRVAGEITPAYAILEPKDVEHIANMMPSLKVVFLIRNPIDRAWSHCRFALTLRMLRTLDSVSELKEFIDGPEQVLRSEYLRTIQIWRTHFPEKQFFVGFYDDILQDPKRLLLDVFRFLDVEASESTINGDLSEKVNISPEKDIPTELLVHLAKKYHPQIAQLSQELGGHANEWLSATEKILQSA